MFGSVNISGILKFLQTYVTHHQKKGVWGGGGGECNLGVLFFEISSRNQLVQKRFQKSLEALDCLRTFFSQLILVDSY